MSVAPITITRRLISGYAAIDKMPRILLTGDKKTGLITLADSGRQFSLFTRHSLVLSLFSFSISENRCVFNFNSRRVQKFSATFLVLFLSGYSWRDVSQ
jgi:hypothetical protein